MVLGLLFRRKAPEPEAAAPPPVPAAKAPPPPPRTDSSDDAAELSVARRQGSQVNLNRLLNAAPHGLNAVLKKNTMDSDLTANFTPTPPSQPPASYQQQQQQQRGEGYGDDVPAPRGKGRERRRSMTMSEMVANMNNIHLGQAAMIMMPQRARQELGGGDPSGQAAAAAPRSRASVPQAMDASSALGSGAALAGMRGLERQPSIIREAMKMQQSQGQPQQQGQQAPPSAQLSSPQVHSSGYSRSSAHHSHSHHHGPGDGLPSANLAQLAAALAGQGPAERAPAATRPGERRASMLLLQHSLGSVASGGGSGNSRSSVMGGPGTGAALGAAGAGGERGGLQQQQLAPQPPVAGGGSVRRSDQGEAFRMRALAPPQANPMEVVINNVRGLNRSWNAGEEGGGSISGGVSGGGGGNSGSGGLGGVSHSGSGAERQHQFGGGVSVGVSGSASHGQGRGSHGQGQSHSAKDMRSRAMRGSYSGSKGPGGGADTAGNNTEDGEAVRPPSVSAHATAPGSTTNDLKLPSISGALPRVRQLSDVSGDGRGALPGLPGGAGKGQLSQADVAAITEALAAQQNDAARIRAAALRKMDTRIKRTVMDRHLGPEDSGGGGGGDDGDSNSYGGSNGRTHSKLSPQPHMQRSPLNRPVGVQPHMSVAESAVARAKARLLETEQETTDELNQLRKNSIIGPNGLLPNGKIPADLLADPLPPPRGRR